MINKYLLKAFLFRSGCFLVALLAFGCEMSIPELEPPIDQNGNIINVNNTNVAKEYIDLGFKGYAIDSIYTEFVFDSYDRYLPKKERVHHDNKKRIKAYRIVGFKKSVIARNNSGEIISKTLIDSIRIKHANGLNYHFNGIRHEVILNDHNFADEMTSYQNGIVYAQVRYYYDNAGYLVKAVLKRAGEDTGYLFYEYDSTKITVTESLTNTYNGSYQIPLIKNDISNTGNVCNVLNFPENSLTSLYVVIPDLFYLGIYGTAVKSLPDQVVQRTSSKHKNPRERKIVLSRVGSQYFYY